MNSWPFKNLAYQLVHQSDFTSVLGETFYKDNAGLIPWMDVLTQPRIPMDPGYFILEHYFGLEFPTATPKP